MRGEIVRVSVSSQPSTSSQGSGQDDYDTLGYVFMWGEGIGNGLLGGGMHKLGSVTGTKFDALFPKAVGSSVVLDAQQIACGSRHATLLTRQGEVFSWGEESGGWLGHGINADVPYPKLVEALTSCTIEFVSCGEYHTCAVTQSGEVYSWGDGAHKFGLLGHGRDISHWTPKRICRSLEGIRISTVSCGPWHTVLVTNVGQLFTFGDGTFGVLGHGDRKSICTPKEIESLKGLKAVRAACGVWHTAAVVEVMVGYSSSSNFFSGKLFTWGDGDKGRLGHEDKEERLVPTCVSALIDYNFRQIACGHSLTVALTTSGHVYTIGSTVYGQLGEPRADGKSPVRVEGKLWDAVVEEIACGSHHVAVLTSKSEVYTWGKGANGRLGHGDIEDKKSPALVEALKDRQVKSIACGSSFTAAICLQKWGAGSEQPLCASCRQPFSFTRKRHKCYNCGIVICHSCSTKKAYRALMAPNPNKPYRVCDSCYGKLSQMSGQSGAVGKTAKKHWQDAGFFEKVERPRTETRLITFPSQSLVVPGGQVEVDGHLRHGKKADSLSSRVAPSPAGSLIWGPTGIMVPFESANELLLHASILQSKRGSPKRGSRSVSPFSRRASPPRSTTPTPTIKGLVSPRAVVDDLKKTNEALSQEVLKLRTQIENMARQHHHRELELQKKVNEAGTLVAAESEKCKAAKEVIKSLTGQLKALTDKFPDAYQNTRMPTPDGRDFLGTAAQLPPVQGDPYVSKSTSSPCVDAVVIPRLEHDQIANGAAKQIAAGDTVTPVASEAGEQNVLGLPGSRGIRGGLEHEGGELMDTSEQNTVREWVDQDESGVYITLVSLPNGGRDLKRVRFSRRRFTEKQAEQWWTENRARVFEKYNVRSMDKSTVFEARTGRE